MLRMRTFAMAAFAAFAFAGAVEAQTKIKVGRTLSGSGFHIPVYIAFAKGLFKEEGLDAEPVRARKKQLYDEMIATRLEIKPGVRELSPEFRLAVASASRRESIRDCLDKFSCSNISNCTAPPAKSRDPSLTPTCTGTRSICCAPSPGAASRSRIRRTTCRPRTAQASAAWYVRTPSCRWPKTRSTARR